MDPRELTAGLGERRVARILELFATAPKTLNAFLDKQFQKEAVLDYITDLDLRRDLLFDFHDLA